MIKTVGAPRREGYSARWMNHSGVPSIGGCNVCAIRWEGTADEIFDEFAAHRCSVYRVARHYADNGELTEWEPRYLVARLLLVIDGLEDAIHGHGPPDLAQ